MVVISQGPNPKILGKHFILGTILKADKNNIYIIILMRWKLLHV